MKVGAKKKPTPWDLKVINIYDKITPYNVGHQDLLGEFGSLS